MPKLDEPTVDEGFELQKAAIDTHAVAVVEIPAETPPDTGGLVELRILHDTGVKQMVRKSYTHPEWAHARGVNTIDTIFIPVEAGQRVSLDVLDEPLKATLKYL